jgi:hypothetical protein
MQVARNVTEKLIFSQEKEHTLFLTFDNSCHHNIPNRAAMHPVCLQ